MPILLFFVALSLTTRYYTEKYTVLKLWSRPNYVDSSLNTISIYLLPMMFKIHTVMAVFMFTVPSIFPKTINDFGMDGSFFTFTSINNDWDYPDWEYRIRDQRVFILISIFVGIVIF